MTNPRNPTAGARPRAAAHPTLPAERAFVVQLRADADLANGVVRGRIEHLLSGAAAVFDTVDQLVACMQHAVRRRTAGALPTPSGGRRRPTKEDSK